MTDAELMQDGLIDPNDDSLDSDYDLFLPRTDLSSREAAIKAWDTRGRKADSVEFSNLRRISGAKGSNPGGIFETPSGERWYVKEYRNPEQGAAEHVSNAVYRAVGVESPVSVLGEGADHGKYASKIIEGDILSHAGLSKENANRVLDGFAADVLTMNWDAVGMGHDNVLVSKGGTPVRIDQGGTLTYRAQGAAKPREALNGISEWDAFYDKTRSYREVFDKAGIKGPNDPAFASRVKAQVRKIVDGRPAGGWGSVVRKNAPSVSATTQKTWADMLDVRTEALARKVGIDLHDVRDSFLLRREAELLFDLNSSEAAIKAWETRRANGWKPKEKNAKKSKAVGDDPTSKPWNPLEVKQTEKALKSLTAQILDDFAENFPSSGITYEDYQLRETVRVQLAKGIQSAAPDKAMLDLAKRGLGVDYGLHDAKELSAALLSSWASTSGDHSRTSVDMQYAAIDEFGLHDAKTNKAWEDVRTQLPKGYSYTDFNKALVGQEIEAGQKVGRAFLREMYNHTQEQLKAQGLTHVTLYRGTKLPGVTGTVAEVQTQPMSSWSTSYDQARAFAKTAVIGVRVPVEKVIGTYATGYGVKSEEEVVLLGGRFKAFVVKSDADGYGGGLPNSEAKFTDLVNKRFENKPSPAPAAVSDPKWSVSPKTFEELSGAEKPSTVSDPTWDKPYPQNSTLTPGQKAALTKKANKNKNLSEWYDLSDDGDEDDEVADDNAVLEIDQDLEEADWPKLAGDKASGIAPGYIYDRKT